MIQKRPLTGGMAALIICAMFVGVWFVLRAGKQPDAGVDYASNRARGACVVFIKQRLRDPSSADWGDTSAWPSVAAGPDQWAVTATYRAKNGFGGVNRETARCVVKEEQANWRLVSLS